MEIYEVIKSQENDYLTRDEESRIMKFVQFFAFCAFLLGAFFSFVDILSDGLLAKQFYPLYECWRGTETERCQNLTFFSDDRDIYFFLTITWLCLGGIANFLQIVHNWCKKDSCLSLFVWPLSLFILIMAPLLMAPVILNLIGAYFVFCNKADGNEDLIK